MIEEPKKQPFHKKKAENPENGIKLSNINGSPAYVTFELADNRKFSP